MGHRRSCALGWYRPSVGVPDTFKAVDNSVPCRVSVCDNAVVIPIDSVQFRSLLDLRFRAPSLGLRHTRKARLRKARRATTKRHLHGRRHRPCGRGESMARAAPRLSPLTTTPALLARAHAAGDAN